MSVQAVARRYASALADVVLARNEAREVQTELTIWDEMLQSNPNLGEVFANPTVALDQKRAVLNRLITELGEINRKFAQVLDERAGVVAATVTTARPVPEGAHERLRTTLLSLTGKQVRIDFVTDPELIGGVVTRIGSTVYDGSVRNQLQQVKEKMIG